MFKIDHKNAQATTELAVFGAILIFLIGSIVRSAMGNSFTQNQNFQAMRMAMLASWNGSTQGITAYNTASVVIIEDRLTQDFSKYGDVDRNPYMAMGSGTFSYEMFYPLSSAGDFNNASPIQDDYINGQHFAFTEALYVTKTLYPPGTGGNPACLNAPPPVATTPLNQLQCQQNQCLRNQREWIGGGTLTESSFNGIVDVTKDAAITATSCLPSPPPSPLPPSTATERACQDLENSKEIFQELTCKGWIVTNPAWSPTDCSGPVDAATSPTQGKVSPLFACTDVKVPGIGYRYTWALSCPLPPTFNSDFFTIFGKNPTQGQIASVISILQQAGHPYKLFYTIVANGGGAAFPNPPAPCANQPCVNQVLTTSFTLPDAYGNNYTNTNGDMAFDLMRNGFYTVPPATCNASPAACPTVDTQFNTPPVQTCGGSGPFNMRCYIAWKWAATDGTSAANIGLNTSNGSFPQYDIDGRLKEVNIYRFTYNSDGTPTMSYLDPQLGDIDSSWDSNSCGPKPGLENTMQMYTFTQNGTYLQVNEGKLYNPQTGQVVRSASKRDNVDLISRTIQLSNNTGRFCTTSSPPTYGSLGKPVSQGGTNPVEVCVDESTADNGCNCFMGSTSNGPQSPLCGFTLAETCYDTNVNQIFVRSRIQDLRGRFWMTNASGQTQVQ